jgi:hypothetical protein
MTFCSSPIAFAHMPIEITNRAKSSPGRPRTRASTAAGSRPASAKYAQITSRSATPSSAA